MCEVGSEETCFACLSGFFMNSRGVCTKEESGNGGDSGEFAGVRSVFVLLVVCLLELVK